MVEASYPLDFAAPRVAVVGAGVAGLACASSLRDAGFEPVVFEKSRGRGGRTATRRLGDRRVDLGAPSFAVRSCEGVEAARQWRAGAVASLWTPRTVTLERGRATDLPVSTRRVVGIPGMNSVCHAMADGMLVHTKVRIEAIKGGTRERTLIDDSGQTHGPFQAVVVATPAPQAVPLLELAPELALQAAQVRYSPCWVIGSALGVFGESLDFDAAVLRDSALDWFSRERSKPGRDPRPGATPGEPWIAHATAEWSRRHVEDDAESVASTLFGALGVALGMGLDRPTDLFAHRWRYSRVERSLGLSSLENGDGDLVACGDWCASREADGSDGIESALRSGRAAAARVVATLGTRR